MCWFKIAAAAHDSCVTLITSVCEWWSVKVCFVPADIEACLDTELNEFPLRMRDWLKNVLVTLYERDEDNNLLTEKQKLRVRRVIERYRDNG